MFRYSINTYLAALLIIFGSFSASNAFAHEECEFQPLLDSLHFDYEEKLIAHKNELERLLDDAEQTRSRATELRSIHDSQIETLVDRVEFFANLDDSDPRYRKASPDILNYCSPRAINELASLASSHRSIERKIENMSSRTFQSKNENKEVKKLLEKLTPLVSTAGVSAKASNSTIEIIIEAKSFSIIKFPAEVESGYIAGVVKDFHSNDGHIFREGKLLILLPGEKPKALNELTAILKDGSIFFLRLRLAENGESPDKLVEVGFTDE